MRSLLEGKFREDLFYRLSVIPIKLPSLRERKEDVAAGKLFFRKNGKEKSSEKKITNEGIKLLIDYPWPGNIRELENLIERLVVISQGNTIDHELIAGHMSSKFKNNNVYDNFPLEEAVFSFEKNIIVQAMKKANGVKNRAAKLLGISTSVLYYKLDKFGLLNEKVFCVYVACRIY